MISDDRPDETGQDFSLTTRQVAEDLDCSPEAIRKLKCENPDRLLDGVHWVKTDTNNLLWSDAGKATLDILKNGIIPENNGPVTGGLATTETDAPQALPDSDSTDTLTLDTLATDFENALRPHARKVARHEAAQHFRRLVEEEKRLEYQRLIEAANRGDDESLYGFADPLYVVGAIASRNGHKALTGGAV